MTIPTTTPPPLPSGNAVKWQVTHISANSDPLDTDKMEALLNDGWQFMGIQATTGPYGLYSYAYFCRQNRKP
jgi:hypothetical protein